MKYFDYVITNFKVSVQYALAYRSSLLIWVLAQGLFQIGSYLSVSAYYKFGTEIESVPQPLFLCFLACFQVISSLYNILIEPSHDILPDQIFDGDLDHILLKPMNPLFLVSTQRIGFDSLPMLILPLVVLVFNLPKVVPVISSLDVVLSVCGLVIATAAYSLVMSIAILICFWSSQNVALWRTSELLLSTGSKPVDVYPKSFGILLGNYIPIILVMNFPVLAITNKLDGLVILKALVLTTALYALNLILWIKGIRRYESAGG